MPKPPKNLYTPLVATSPAFDADEVEAIRAEFGFPSDHELLQPDIRQKLQDLAQAAYDEWESSISAPTKIQEYLDKKRRATAKQLKDFEAKPILQLLLNSELAQLATLLDKPEISQSDPPGRPRESTSNKALTDARRGYLERVMRSTEKLVEALERMPSQEPQLIDSLQLKQLQWECHRELFLDDIPQPGPTTAKPVYNESHRYMRIGRHKKGQLLQVLRRIQSECTTLEIEKGHELRCVLCTLLTDVTARLDEVAQWPNAPSGTTPKGIVSEAVVRQLVAFHHKHTGKLGKIAHHPANVETGAPSRYTGVHLDFIKCMLAKFPDHSIADGTLETHVNRAVNDFTVQIAAQWPRIRRVRYLPCLNPL